MTLRYLLTNRPTNAPGHPVRRPKHSSPLTGTVAHRRTAENSQMIAPRRGWRSAARSPLRALLDLRDAARLCRRVMPAAAELWPLLASALGLTLEGTHEPCSDCGRACAVVLPDIPTAKPCRGPLLIAQCVECVGVIEIAEDHPTYHVIARRRRIPAKEFYGREPAST